MFKPKFKEDYTSAVILFIAGIVVFVVWYMADCADYDKDVNDDPGVLIKGVDKKS